MGVYKDGSDVSPDGNYPTTNLNFPFMRYAEVLLIDAEAKLMQGKSADAEINIVRNRAGLPSKTGATMEDLKRERRSELSAEMNYRHFDLVRWGDAEKTYKEPLRAFENSEIVRSRDFNPAVNGRWPIPLTEIEKSEGVLKQNSGY